MAIVHVVKTFRRSISRDYNTCDFSTQVGKDYEISTAADLTRAGEQLFKLAYNLTRDDMLKVKNAGLLAAEDVPGELTKEGVTDAN